MNGLLIVEYPVVILGLLSRNATWIVCLTTAGHHAHTFEHSLIPGVIYCNQTTSWHVFWKPENAKETHVDSGIPHIQ